MKNKKSKLNKTSQARLYGSPRFREAGGSSKKRQLQATSYLSRSSATSRWYRDKLQASRGFTLIELLISLAMIAIITGAMLSIVSFSGTRHSLTLEANKVLAAVRSAQSYSLATPNNEQEKICGFGFEAADDTKTYKVYYIYYTGEDADINSCKDQLRENPNGDIEYYRSDLGSWSEEYELSEGINFSAATADEAIFFSVPYGEVYKNGDELGEGVNLGNDSQVYEIETTDSGDDGEKTITINKYGKIDMD